MRNTGWYIPFWKKSKRHGGEQQGNDRAERRRRPKNRSDEELERVRADWIARYNTQAHALKTLGLSVGAPRADITVMYERLLRNLEDGPEGEERRRAIEHAYSQLSTD